MNTQIPLINIDELDPTNLDHFNPFDKAQPGRNKPIIHVSFSGGLTSAYMTAWIKQNYSESHQIIVTYANTGLEHEKTLEFIRNCDEQLGFKR